MFSPQGLLCPPQAGGTGVRQVDAGFGVLRVIHGEDVACEHLTVLASGVHEGGFEHQGRLRSVFEDRLGFGCVCGQMIADESGKGQREGHGFSGQGDLGGRGHGTFRKNDPVGPDQPFFCLRLRRALRLADPIFRRPFGGRFLWGWGMVAPFKRVCVHRRCAICGFCQENRVVFCGFFSLAVR